MSLPRNTDRIMMATGSDPPLALFEQPYFTRVSKTDMNAIRRKCIKEKFDVTVLISGKPVGSVHKDLFEVVSPIFKFLIRKNITDETPGDSNETKLQLPYYMNLEMERDVFNVIRYFFNTDNLPMSMKTKVELAVKVMEASFHYSIKRLMKRTIALLRENIKPESSFKILQAARAVECSELEELALETIYRNPSQLLENEDFLNLGCYDACRILSSDSLACKEGDVFQAAYSWALKQAKENPSENPSISLKYYFSQVSTCIRFPLLSLEEFALQTAATGDLLSYEETTKIFQYGLLPEEFKSTISLKYSAKPRSYLCDKRTVQIKPDNIRIRPFESLHPPVENSIPRKRAHAAFDTVSTTSFLNTSTADISPPKVKRLPEFQERMVEEDSDDDQFHLIISRKNKEVSTFEDAVRRYVAKENPKENFTEIRLSNFKIENNHKTILFKQCTKVVIDAKCDFIRWSDASFFNFVSHFDTMRYILFDTSGNLPMTPENIWGLKQDIFLKFNGVIFLNMKHNREFNIQKEDTLVLNYISDSKRIMSNSKFRPKVLALSNCEFSVKLIKERAKELERLTLYRVWGDFTLDEVMKDFSNLKELCVWKHVTKDFMPGSTLSAPLCLNFSNPFSTKHLIRKLALFRTELRFPIRCSSAATSVTELVLDLCYSVNNERNANIVDVFHLIFPNVTKLVLLNDMSGKLYKVGNVPVGTPSLINCVIKNINPLEEILVRSMRWGESEVEDTQLASFLQNEVHLVGRPRNFQIMKTSEGSWRGARLDENLRGPVDVDRDCWTNKMEYECYNLNYFYDSVESFELYFSQDHQFPKPILWI